MTASDRPPERYRIRIRGHLDPVWSAWFEGLAIAQEDDGMVALLLLALSVGAVNLGCKVAVLVRGDREGEFAGGVAGLLALLILERSYSNSG